MYYIAIKIVLHLAEKQRISSYHYTKNRLFAYDVVSSYRMIHSIWVVPILSIVNFFALCFALTHFTELKIGIAFRIVCAWFAIQPFYVLLFVKLWDVWHSESQRLRRCLYYAFKRPLIMDLIQLKSDIMDKVSTHLLHTQNSNLRSSTAHSHT
jgi:hypothetical protein